MYTVDQISGESIIVITFSEPFDWHVEIPDAAGRLIGLLDAQSRAAYVICDFAYVPANLTDVTFAANFVTRTGNKVLRHQNMRGFLVVQAIGLVELAAKGMSSDLFGNVPVTVFDTMEEALEYARANIRAN